MRFIVATRLYSDKIGNFDASAASNDKELVTRRGFLSEHIMGPSLRNQTDKDFKHYTIVNDNASRDVSLMYKACLDNAGIDTVLVRKSEWPDVLRAESDEDGDRLCVARIDDDDAINADAVSLAKSHFRTGVLTVYGYTTGIRARIGEGFYRIENVGYRKSGHHSIFQTYMYDAGRGKEVFDPYDCDHSDVVGCLSSRGMSRRLAESVIANGDADVPWPAFLYLRHKDSVSTRNKAFYDCDGRFQKTDADPDELCKRLGVQIDVQEKILNGTLI